MRHAFAVWMALSFVFLTTSAASAQVKSRAQREAEECIKELMTTKDTATRKSAIVRLMQLEGVKKGVSKDATPWIAMALKDKDAGVRAAAATALASLRYEPKSWVKDVADLVSDKEKREVNLA